MPLNRTPPQSPASPVCAPDNAHVPAPLPALPSSEGQALKPTIALTRSHSITPSLDALKVPVLQQIHGSSSEPNLNTGNPNIHTRKRKRDDEMLKDFMTEMRQMFKDLKDDQEKRCDRMCSAVEEIRSSVEFLSGRCESLQEKVDKLEVVRSADIQYIAILEERLESYERNSRSTCIEIRNIPSATPEAKTTLLDTFINTAKVLNVPIRPSDVRDIFRTGAKNPAKKTIIVDLTSVLLKEKVISMFRNFNKGSSRLTTEHLHISGPAVPIFISENLTSKMKRIFYLAREFAKENDVKFCWVSHGKVFLRKRENGRLVRIVNESDLAKAKDLI